MQPLPHHYTVTASLSDSQVTLSSPGLDAITSDAPAEFDGPGNVWSPETLLAAAVADCFLLSFRAIAGASRFRFVEINCKVDATLDRLEKVTRFTQLNIEPTLTISDPAETDKALKLLAKAEAACLVTNSLNAEINFKPSVNS